MDNLGIIFDIQRFSIHDGPGIRTTIFLKGCTLNCFWCHNPEGIKYKPEVLFYSNKCIFCGECILRCTHSAHKIDESNHIYIKERCIVCGECIKYCYSNALEIAGKKVSVEEVFKEIIRDYEYYKKSNGGITLSGGEPLIQTEFCYSLLEKCKSNGIHTAIETSGNCRWDQIEKVLPYTDLIMMDIKHMNSEKHKLVTGVRNELILENAQKLAEEKTQLIFRIPVIPTVNNTIEEITEIAKFISYLQEIRKDKYKGDSPEIKLELLKFHKLAGDKYKSLGINNCANDLPIITNNEMEKFKAIAIKFFSNVI